MPGDNKNPVGRPYSPPMVRCGACLFLRPRLAAAPPRDAGGRGGWSAPPRGRMSPWPAAVTPGVPMSFESGLCAPSAKPGLAERWEVWSATAIGTERRADVRIVETVVLLVALATVVAAFASSWCSRAAACWSAPWSRPLAHGQRPAPGRTRPGRSRLRQPQAGRASRRGWLTGGIARGPGARRDRVAFPGVRLSPGPAARSVRPEGGRAGPPQDPRRGRCDEVMGFLSGLAAPGRLLTGTQP